MKVASFRSFKKGNLLGFAKIELPSGLIINDVTILAGERGPWASPPSKPMLDRDGIAMKGSDGKLKYQPIVEFASREVRSKWSDAVIAALRVSNPEAFDA